MNHSPSLCYRYRYTEKIDKALALAAKKKNLDTIGTQQSQSQRQPLPIKNKENVDPDHGQRTTTDDTRPPKNTISESRPVSKACLSKPPPKIRHQIAPSVKNATTKTMSSRWNSSSTCATNQPLHVGPRRPLKAVNLPHGDYHIPVSTKPVISNRYKSPLFVRVDRTLDNVRLIRKMEKTSATNISQSLSVDKKAKVDKEPIPLNSTTVDIISNTETTATQSPAARPRALNNTWKALASALNLRKPNVEPDQADCTVEDLKEETTESIPSLNKPSGKDVASTSITDQHATKKSSDNQSQSIKPLVNYNEGASREFRPVPGHKNPSVTSSQKKADRVDRPVTGMGSITTTERKKDRLRCSSLSDKENHSAAMNVKTTKQVATLNMLKGRQHAKRLSTGSALDQRQDRQIGIHSRQRARVEADRKIVKARLEHYQKQQRESKQTNGSRQHQAPGTGSATTRPGRLTSLHQTTNKDTVGERRPMSRSTAAAKQQPFQTSSNKRQHGQVRAPIGSSATKSPPNKRQSRASGEKATANTETTNITEETKRKQADEQKLRRFYDLPRNKQVLEAIKAIDKQDIQCVMLQGRSVKLGQGSFGKVYLRSYHGKLVVEKQMIRRPRK